MLLFASNLLRQREQYSTNKIPMLPSARSKAVKKDIVIYSTSGIKLKGRVYFITSLF